MTAFRPLLAWVALMLAGVVAVLPPSAAVPAASGVLVEREAYLMGTRLRVQVTAAGAGEGAEAIERAFREVGRLEGVLSSWREDSELSRLNRTPPGVPTPLSGELFGLLVEVEEWGAGFGGAFEPAVGALIDAWGLRDGGRRPGPAELARARALSGADAFVLDEGRSRVTRRAEGSWMTAGGFGKGAALRAAGRVLRAAGIESGLLDFGGQLLAIGGPAEGQAWVVAIAHPARRTEPAFRIRLADRSAATSGAAERFVEIEGERHGHILDPRSGRPKPAWGSVTVVAEDPLVADLAATALFVLGPERGMEWAAPRVEVGVLFLEQEGEEIRATWNRALEPWLLVGEV